MKKFENLLAVYFDEANNCYDLEFQFDGKSEFISVSADDHPEAATDEFYFDDKKVVEKISEENK